MKRWIFALAALSVIGLGLARVSADHHEGDANQPPKVGQVVPDFELKNVEGKTVKLSDVAKGGKTALLFMRGFPGYQCPICNRQFGELLSDADKIKQAGGSVVLIYPGDVSDLDAKAREFIQGRRMPDHFYFLTDPDYKAVNAYHLRWNAPRETAYPSTFILDADRKVHFAKVSKEHGGRTTSAEVLAELKKIGK